jgi:predicted nucleotidyltransferase
MTGAKPVPEAGGGQFFNLPPALPANVHEILGDFVGKAQQAFGEDLSAAVLFGSAADGGLRKSSDVNLILVLRRFSPDCARVLRNDLETARAAILLRVMFLAKEEIPAACEAFAQKFSDILRRRMVLFGPDPFAEISIPRAAQVWRLRQVLLNLLLRLREVYVEQDSGSRIVLSMLAESVGALRSSAVLLLLLEEREPAKPKQALLEVAELAAPGKFAAALSMLSQLRETGALSGAEAQQVLIAVMELAAAMHARAAELKV